jgi:hypothetical protein
MYENGKVKPPLEIWRMCAKALCEWACGYANGRSKLDPVYIAVTEGRDGPTDKERKSYSSCGDLAHWMLKRLGLREDWVNRTDDNLFGPWMPVANVTNLHGTKCPIEFIPKSDWSPDSGDIILVWLTGYDVHVMVVLDPPREGKLRTANYGASGMSASTVTGAKIASNKLTWDGRHWFYGSKIVQRVISLADVVPRITAKPDMNGPDAELVGEASDAIEYGINAT